MSFSGTGRSPNSIAWKRWLLWNKWTLQWSKKIRRTLISKTSMVSVVNFHCMQMSLVMSIWFIFGDDWNGVPCSHHVFCLWQRSNYFGVAQIRLFWFKVAICTHTCEHKQAKRRECLRRAVSTANKSAIQNTLSRKTRYTEWNYFKII